MFSLSHVGDQRSERCTERAEDRMMLDHSVELALPSSCTAGCSVPGAGLSGHRHQRQVRSTQQVSDMMKVLKINNTQLKGGKGTMPKTQCPR